MTHDAAKAKAIRLPPLLPPFDPPGTPPPPPQLANMPVCSKRRYNWITDYPMGEGELHYNRREPC